MKQLGEILKSVGLPLNGVSFDTPVKGVALDSRKVKDGFLFIAYKGVALNGHDFIGKAIENGATTVILEDQNYAVDDNNVNYILVDDARSLTGPLAEAYYDYPTKDLVVVGVTGTNGKTTCATLMYQLMKQLSFKVGLISTIENKYLDVIEPAALTTPDPISLHQMFWKMREAGVTHVFMEVSSHALDQKRTAGIEFDIGVFTNITHDHLDYHTTFLEYINAKKLLFDHLSSNSKALVNIDDPNGKVMVQNSKAEVSTYALKRPADYKAKIISNALEGLHMLINQKEIFLKLVGDFNAYNALAIFGVADLLGVDEMDVLRTLSSLNSAEGRMDILYGSKKKVKAVVDYAHTPDALEKVLKTLKSASAQGRIITVVGCGGDRDKSKRPEMAKVAERYSSISIFTSDNPRSEDPEVILSEMIKGLDDQTSEYLEIVDRKEAIKTAYMLSREDDIILIAGKGHEKYQLIKGQKYPFDDKEIISALLH